jgi:hypothetical protein
VSKDSAQLKEGQIDTWVSRRVPLVQEDKDVFDLDPTVYIFKVGMEMTYVYYKRLKIRGQFYPFDKLLKYIVSSTKRKLVI